MSYEFEVTRRVEFSETDMAGLMHFSNYFRFMETAEHGFCRSLGIPIVGSGPGVGMCLPRVHVECDYSVPLRFEDEVQVRLLVERKSRRSLTYQFRFMRLNGASPQEVARGRMTIVSIEFQPDGSLQAVPLPAAIASQVEQAPARLLGEGVPEKAASASSPAQAVNARSKRLPGRLVHNMHPPTSAPARLRRGATLRPDIPNGTPAGPGSGNDLPQRHD